jgi:archaellum component FlaC
MTDTEKLDLIATLLPGLVAEVKGIGASQQGMREELTGMRLELKRVADAVEVVATEQARLREDMGRIGSRISRVEHANADLWQAIELLRPAH